MSSHGVTGARGAREPVASQATEPLASVAPPARHAPWYESNLLWCPLALAIAVILTVIAAAKHDLRWLLWFAWPCLGVAVWCLAKRTREVWPITLLGSALIGVCLLYLGNWLRPSAPAAISTSTATLPSSRSDQTLPPSSSGHSTSVNSTTPAETPSPTAAQPQFNVRPKVKAPTSPKPSISTPAPSPGGQPVSEPGSLVQSNSGGVNVQQGTTGINSPIINSPITIGDTPKTITPADMASVVLFFQQAKSTARVAVLADQYSGAAPFSDNFYDALKAGGWAMQDAGVSRYMVFSAAGKRFQGAIVVVKGEPLKPDQTVSFHGSDPPLLIGRVLDAYKIPRILQRDMNQPDGLITINFTGGFPNRP
jgi:hypothetical protein